MSKGWMIKTLKDVALIGAGNPAPQDEDMFNAGIFPFFRTSDVGRVRVGEILEASDRLNEKGIRGLRLWPAGTILLPKSGASTFLNHRVTMGVAGYVSSHLATVVADEQRIRTRFLFHQLTTVRAQDLMQDSKYPSLGLAEIGQISIRMPPISEQERIVAILDEAFERVATVIAHVEQAKGLLAESFQSRLAELFSPLNLACTPRSIDNLVQDGVIAKPSDGNHGEIHPRASDYVSEGVPFLMACDLTDQGVDQEGCKFISHNQADSLRTGFAKDGDILISHKGTIGRVSYLKTEHKYVMLTPQITYYRTLDQNKLSRRFLYWQLLSPTFQTQFLRAAEGGSTRAYVGITRQRQLSLFIPKPERQAEIVEQCDLLILLVEQLAQSHERHVAVLKELKQSLLHQAFSGNL